MHTTCHLQKHTSHSLHTFPLPPLFFWTPPLDHHHLIGVIFVSSVFVLWFCSPFLNWLHHFAVVWIRVVTRIYEPAEGTVPTLHSSGLVQYCSTILHTEICSIVLHYQGDIVWSAQALSTGRCVYISHSLLLSYFTTFSVLCFNQQSKHPFLNTIGHSFRQDSYQVWGLGVTSASCVDAGHLGNLALLI